MHKCQSEDWNLISNQKGAEGVKRNQNYLQNHTKIKTEFKIEDSMLKSEKCK